MSTYCGDIAVNGSVLMNFSTYDSTGASVTVTGLTAADIQAYKDGGLTQRSSSSGMVVSVDFDGMTGCHQVSINTSDNTDAGFWAAGHEYQIFLSSFTCDGKTVSLALGTFSIERAGGVLELLKARTPNAAAGAAGGLFIAGTNAATSITTALTANLIGNITGALSGAVGSVTGAVGSVAGAVGSVTGAVGSVSAGGITAASIATDAIDADALAADALTEIFIKVLTTALTESYAAIGVAPTLAQAILWIHQMMENMVLTGTTLSVKKLDGTTQAGTLTVNNGSAPTTITRAS